jgi:hypothetical protein
MQPTLQQQQQSQFNQRIIPGQPQVLNLQQQERGTSLQPQQLHYQQQQQPLTAHSQEQLNQRSIPNYQQQQQQQQLIYQQQQQLYNQQQEQLNLRIISPQQQQHPLMAKSPSLLHRQMTLPQTSSQTKSPLPLPQQQQQQQMAKKTDLKLASPILDRKSGKLNSVIFPFD